jgi:hypothetical protein
MSPYFILQQSEALGIAKGIGSGWVKLTDTLNNYSKTRRRQLLRSLTNVQVILVQLDTITDKQVY